MNSEEIADEVKRKQEYMRSKKYVEIRLDSESDGAGRLSQIDNNSMQIAPPEKQSVNVTEVYTNSD